MNCCISFPALLHPLINLVSVISRYDFMLQLVNKTCIFSLLWGKETTLCYITGGNNVNISCNPLMRDPEFITFAQFRDAKKKKKRREQRCGN